MSHIYLKTRQGFPSIKLLPELNVNAAQYVQFAKVVIYLSIGSCSHFGGKGDVNLSTFYAFVHLTQLPNVSIYRFILSSNLVNETT